MRAGTKTSKVAVSMWLTRAHYDALQRWRSENEQTQVQAFQSGLELLPGFAPILKEEQEAYATYQEERSKQLREEEQHIRDAADSAG